MVNWFFQVWHDQVFGTETSMTWFSQNLTALMLSNFRNTVLPNAALDIVLA